MGLYIWNTWELYGDLNLIVIFFYLYDFIRDPPLCQNLKMYNCICVPIYIQNL